MNIYKWFWSRIGGRPWTYILRDSWVDYELVWILGLLALGAYLGDYFGVRALLKDIVKIFIGVVLGHLFWGTKWRRGQKGGK